MPKFSFVNIKKIKYLWFYALAIGVIIFVYYNFRIVEGAKSRKRLELKVGDKISVYWEQDDEWYRGTVSNVHKNGDIDINYDDGDKEKNITPWDDEVKKITKGTNKQPIVVAKDKNTDTSFVTDPEKYGNYKDSCQNVTLTKNANNEDLLNGDCLDENDDQRPASIIVTPADIGKISNCKGVLTRGPCP